MQEEGPSFVMLHIEECDRLRKIGKSGNVISTFVYEYPEDEKTYIEGKRQELEKLEKEWISKGGDTIFYSHLKDPELTALERRPIYKKAVHVLCEHPDEKERVMENIKAGVKKENPDFHTYLTISGEI